jgi:hypothetical protein
LAVIIEVTQPFPPTAYPKETTMNRKLATAVAASLTAIGSATFGLAVAAPAGAATPPAATAHTSTAAHTVRAWLRHHRRAVLRAVVVVSAGAIGIKPSALVTELRAGKTISDVASEHGVSTQTVINALVSKGDAKIESLESKGKLSSTRAAQITAALPNLAAKIVAHQFGQHAAATPSTGGTTAG